MKNITRYTNIYFWILFLQNFLFFSSHGALKNLSPYLIQLGLSKTFIGFFMNINAIGLILFVLFLGRYVENISKKILILITYSLEFISYIFMFFYSTNIILLVILRIISSFSYAIGFTVNASLAFDFIPVEKRVGGIALFGISGIISNPISTYLGEKVIKIFSYKYLFLLGAIFAFFAIFTTLFMKEKRKNYEKIDNSLLRVLKRKELWIFFIYGFILGGAFSIFETFIPPLSFEKFNFSKLSLYFIAYAITTISFRIIFSKKFDVIDLIILLFTAFSSLIIGAINTGFLVNKFQLMLSGFLYGITHAILYPLLSSGVVKLSLEKDKYLVNSTFIACYISGCITISTLSGRLADLTKKTESVFLALTFIGIISLFSTLFIKNKNYLQFKKKN